ncbi:MAG: ATP-binding protein [Thermoflexales bacterium]|nr:ATP-binding protein [Thermoflexales bacterium]
MTLGQLSDPNAAVPPRDGGEDCPVCQNKRWLLDARGELKPCPRCGVAQHWKQEGLRAFSSRSGVSERQTFTSFKTAFKGVEDENLGNCLEAAEAFADLPDGHWLVMVGARGNGKSHLCAAVDNHLRHAGIASLFITMSDLLGALKDAMDLQANTEQESYSGRLRTFKTAPVLILDDVGAESSSAFSQGILFEIIDYRYRNRLATMIVTNVPFDAFDPRVASRMQDAAFCTVVENLAPDYRKRPVEER